MRLLLAFGLGLMAPAAALAQTSTNPLVRAHQQYNARAYDDAIRSAEEAARAPALARPAALVLARAHLERFRASRVAADLEAARAGLLALDRASLAPRERLDWTIGMGELLYFDGRFGAAAEFFEVAAAQEGLLESGAREPLLDWWGETLDRAAQADGAVNPERIYRRVIDRMDAELARDDRSPAANYWLAKAAAGLEAFERAWAACEAGWLRAAPSGPAAERLRGDLNRLVTTVLIPERARRASPSDPETAARQLLEQWEAFKARYRAG